ncbi:MAG: TIM barrel protein [Betaproteobacteria bacterium]|nr:MAG: TIM barrel protein [Betaproteobacteria bacterium]
MPKFAANLTMLYNEVDFLDRFAAAAEGGFKGVEYLFPYAYPKEQLAERLHQHGVKQVLHNLPAGDWAAGERGIACQPDRVGEFQDGVGKAIDYARALGCGQVNCLAGIAPAGVDREKVRGTFVANLRFAAEKLGAAGIKLLIEPVNTYDIPGFWLSRTQQALDVIRDQLADNPGRNEPGTGEINYRFLFGFIDSIGYEGWIGCEYKPKGKTIDGLGWRAAHGV